MLTGAPPGRAEDATLERARAAGALPPEHPRLQ